MTTVLAGAVFSAGAATVEISEGDEDYGKVTWSERALANGSSRLTLKAEAATGYFFSGWSVAESNVVAWTEDLRYPGTLTATVASNAVVTASFLPCEEDTLEFDITDLLGEELECGENVSQTIDVDSWSFPTLTFKGLPPGLSFSPQTLTVFGAPTEPGFYTVEANGVNASGFTFRSVTTVRVANLEGPRVSGVDTTIPVGEYFYSEIGNDDPSDIFVFTEPPESVTVSGTVPGLVWTNGWALLYGTPTEPGEYTIKVRARFATGSDETATTTLTVVGPEPSDYGLDVEQLNGLRVGEELEAESFVIGQNESDFVINRVTGLPKGLSAVSWTESGKRLWGIKGMIREAGRFTVSVEITDYSGESSQVVTALEPVVILDTVDVYFSAISADTTRGTVVGAGAVSPAEDVTLTARPRSGYVFAGWYDLYDERLALLDDVDYRTPSVTLPAGTDFALLCPIATFVAKENDEAPNLADLDDEDFAFAPDERFETRFAVDSFSLPTLTFKGLPRGMSCQSSGVDEFVLVYDPSVAEASPARYAVTVSAVNASGAKSSVAFRVTVGNRTDSRIQVEDDYGEFVPGEAIDPIDLSGAVDFARGETLTVPTLPRGLSYNAKADAKKGIAAHTITGTPTVPGDYTLKFSARVVVGEKTNSQNKVTYIYENASATSFLTVLPYPELQIEIDEDAAASGCKVSGAGNYKTGTKVTLKATAAKGWVFAGWEGLEDVEGLAALNPKLTYVTGEDDVWVSASFLPVDEDGIYVAEPSMTEAGFAAEWPLNTALDEEDLPLIADLLETGSWPTVKVDGLPSGVKFSTTTFMLSGVPKKSGVWHVTVTAKSAGGYTFVRVFDIAVLNADGSLPTEKPLENAAEIDFAPLNGLTTGVYCPTGSVVLTIGTKPGTGAAVKKVSVSGAPAGLDAVVAIADGEATVEYVGTPTKPGRQTVTVSVTYDDRKTLKSQATVTVADGGSFYLYVLSDDETSGTVSGGGVYASGATVKLSAKAKSKRVFAGWHVSEDVDSYELFEPLRDVEGMDPRTASVSFPFRPGDFRGAYELIGVFGSAAEDTPAEIELESDVWEIDPSASSTFFFEVESLSAPKVSFANLPKGVSVDAARGVLTYEPTAAVQPGIYTATATAKNLTQKTATTCPFEVRVANRVSEVIDGLDPDMDAYCVSVGTVFDPTLILPTVDEGWTLDAKNLPPGLSYKNGVITGVPSKAEDRTVTFTATTGKGSSKRTEIATIIIRVTALPQTLCGTFVGVLADDGMTTGSVTVTTTASGKISASVKTAAKSYSFSAKSWDDFAEGIASVTMRNKDGSELALTISETDDWRTWSASGELTLGEKDLTLTAQRNSYGAKDGDPEARQIAAAMAGKSTIDDWKVSVSANGTVSISGKYAKKSVSGSTVLQVDGEQFFARYIKFLDKKTTLILTFYLDEQGRAVECQSELR